MSDVELSRLRSQNEKLIAETRIVMAENLQLRKLLDYRYKIPESLGLSEHEKIILLETFSCPERIVPYEQLALALYARRDIKRPPHWMTTISHKINHIRAKLQPYGIFIVVVAGVGIKLDNYSRRELTKLLEGGDAQAKPAT